MHIHALGFVLAAFSRAKQLGKQTRIYGCGIGPLEKDKKFEKVVTRILNLADEIELRDSASVKWAEEKIHRHDIKNIGDPAANFVKRWKQEHTVPGKKSFLNLYLRDWTTEYQGTLTNHQFKEIKERYEKSLGQWINKLSSDFDLRPRFFPMHHLSFGRDDRDYNRWFAQYHLKDLDPYVEKKPLTIDQILESMQEAMLCICMRFHSVLFADTLGSHYIALDYTNGGKIYGYLADQNKLEHMRTLNEIADGKRQSIPPKILRKEL